MPIKPLLAAILAVLVCAASAIAASAPTLGAPTVFKAGQKTPVDIGGNDLHHGATIRQGTRLLRWKVTMHGASAQGVTLRCPAGTKHVGLGLNDHPKVAFALLRGEAYGNRTIRVRFYTTSKSVDPVGATGHVYALCKG